MKSKNLALILALGLLTACGNTQPAEAPEAETEVTTEAEETEVEETTEAEATEDFEIVEIEEVKDDALGLISVQGRVKNNSGKDVSYLQIEIPIYDADGAKLGTAAANINDLKADEEWKFDAISGVSEEGAKADLEKAELTGF